MRVDLILSKKANTINVRLRHERIVSRLIPRLERTAGTKEYARQVSALLEETVEPAHFKLHSLPTENSIPDGRYNPTGFPLWYKEPYKMPLVFLYLVTSFHLFRSDYTHQRKIGYILHRDNEFPSSLRMNKPIYQNDNQ